MGIAKQAVKRDSGYPVGISAPLHIDCPCGATVPVEADFNQCTECGIAYDGTGWIVEGTSHA